MAETLAKELADSKAALTERDAEVAALKQERDEQATHIEALEKAAKESGEESNKEAMAEGATAARVVVAERAEKFGSEFAIEHLESSDEDCQAAYVAKLEAENKALVAAKENKGKPLATEISEDSKAADYDSRRKELMAEGMGATAAAKAARKEYPSNK